MIDPGSGVVAMPDSNDREPGVTAAGDREGRISVWFEGNRFGAINLQRWADRVFCAADRMVSRYPTRAVAVLAEDDFTCVGLFALDTGMFSWQVPDPMTVLQNWSSTPMTVEDLVTSSAVHEAGRAMADLRASGPAGMMQAQMLSAHGPALYRGR
jgi:hypothetical protein